MRIRGIALFLAAALCITLLMPTSVLAQEENKLVLKTATVGGVTTQYYYDAQGNCVRTEDDNPGNVTQYEYRTDGTLKSKTVSRKGQSVEKIEYDACGNLLSERTWDQDGNISSMKRSANRYDEFGRLVETSRSILFASGSIRGEREYYSYQDETDPESPLYVYQRDGFTVTNGVWEWLNTYLVFYDAEGRVTGIQESNGLIENNTYSTYDARGNAVEVIQYIYENGNAVNISTTCRNAYNDLGQLMEVTYQTTLQIQTYDGEPSEQLETRVEEYRYDALGNKIQQTTYASDGSILYDRIWEYDPHGNLLRHTEDGLILEEYSYVPLSDALWK